MFEGAAWPVRAIRVKGPPVPVETGGPSAILRWWSGPRALEDLLAQPDDRVVLAVDHALLERDERVVGDLDVLGADLGAALGDVAVAEAVLLLRRLLAVGDVEGVHVELGDPHEVARAGEVLLVLL